MILICSIVFQVLFFGAPMWASVFRYITYLTELDSILALASRMAYGLERFTSIEASLLLAALCQEHSKFFRFLIYYKLRRQWVALVEDHQSLTTYRSYVTLMELGCTWFQLEMFLDRVDLSKNVDGHRMECCHVLSHSSKLLAAVLFEQQPVLIGQGLVLTKKG